MPKRVGNNPRATVLKIDKDVRISPQLRVQYIQDSARTLLRSRIRILKIRTILTPHGEHFEFTVNRRMNAQTTNDWQFRLGDDGKRVAFNQARIDAGFADWNKLFEVTKRGRVRKGRPKQPDA